MACSSPRLVVWIGKQDIVSTAQKSFWSTLETKVCLATPDRSAADVMNKIVMSSTVAIDHTGVHLIHDEQGFIHRIQATPKSFLYARNAP